MAVVKKNQKAIRESLMLQLKAKGADVSHFESLIDDYIFYWQQEKKMQRDIAKNGMLIDAISAQGKPYQKENPAIKSAALYNKQKLAILKEMGLTTDTCHNADDDEL